MKRYNFGFEDRPSLQGKPEEININGDNIGLVYLVIGIIIGIFILGGL